MRHAGRPAPLALFFHFPKKARLKFLAVDSRDLPVDDDSSMQKNTIYKSCMKPALRCSFRGGERVPLGALVAQEQGAACEGFGCVSLGVQQHKSLLQ